MNEKKLITLFVNAIFTIVAMFILYMLVLFNLDFIQKNIIPKYKNLYYTGITLFIFIVLPVANIYLYRALKRSKKVQAFLQKLFD